VHCVWTLRALTRNLLTYLLNNDRLLVVTVHEVHQYGPRTLLFLVWLFLYANVYGLSLPIGPHLHRDRALLPRCSPSGGRFCGGLRRLWSTFPKVADRQTDRQTDAQKWGWSTAGGKKHYSVCRRLDASSDNVSSELKSVVGKQIEFGWSSVIIQYSIIH